MQAQQNMKNIARPRRSLKHRLQRLSPHFHNSSPSLSDKSHAPMKPRVSELVGSSPIFVNCTSHDTHIGQSCQPLRSPNTLMKPWNPEKNCNFADQDTHRRGVFFEIYDVIVDGVDKGNEKVGEKENPEYWKWRELVEWRTTTRNCLTVLYYKLSDISKCGELDDG